MSLTEPLTTPVKGSQRAGVEKDFSIMGYLREPLVRTYQSRGANGFAWQWAISYVNI